MRGQHKGNVVELFGEETSHRNIPGVRVYDVDLAQFLHLREVKGESVYGRLEFFFRVAGNRRIRLETKYVKVAGIQSLGTPTVNFDLNCLGKFYREIFDMHSGSAIDI